MFLQNLQLILWLAGIFSASWGADTVLGIKVNVLEMGQDFEASRLANGFVKALLTLIALILLTVVVSFLPEILANNDIVVANQETINGISLLSIAGIMVAGAGKYFKDAITKLTNKIKLTEEEKVELAYKELANDNKEEGDTMPGK